MLEETVDLVVNSQAIFTFIATAIGAAGAAGAAALAIPAVTDRIHPAPRQDSLADFLPFVELMTDRKTLRCRHSTYLRLIEFTGAELTLAPYTSPTGRGRAELFLARKQLLDEVHKFDVDEIRIFQIKSRSPIADNVVHPIPVLDDVNKIWTKNFSTIFRLRTFAMVSIRSTDWLEAQERLDKIELLFVTTLPAYGPSAMAEPDPYDKRNPDYSHGPLAALGAIFSPVTRPMPRGDGWADNVSQLVAADRVSFSRNEARGILRFSNGREDKYATIIGIRDCGDKTSEDIMRKIVALPIEATIFQVMRPHNPTKDKLVLEREVKSSRFMRLSTAAPLEYLQVVGLIDGADANNRATLHDYALSYIVYGRTPRECLDNEALIMAEIAPSGATAVREHIASQATWFSQAPGDALWPRAFRYTSSNIAANLYLQRANEGFRTSNWADRPITHFPTMDGQPYAFQFHSEPSRYNREFGSDKETVAHGLIIGPTGAGKTLFLTFVAGMAMSIPNLRVYLFDRLNGCECFTRCAGGDYLNFTDANTAIDMNPLLQPDTPANQVFLKNWISMIGDANPDNANDMAEISRAVQTVFDENISSDLKLISNLLETQFEAGGALRANLRKWADPTLYGSYFNGERDALDLTSKRLIAFDMTTVLDDRVLAPALVDYLVHRIRQVSFQTQDPALIFIDETAPMLEANPRFRDSFVKVGLREGRKAKQAYILAFQDPQAVAKTGIGESIRQQCQTVYFFRNRNTRPDDYSDFNLTEGELDFVTGVTYADERSRYAVLVKKYSQDDASAHSAILNLDLSVLGRHLKIFNSGRPAVAELTRAIAQDPDNFLEGYLSGRYARKRAA